ncbi:MAG: 30S ribosomal protein S3 [Nanoarchaeota archaeon]|nr:30S ribosomal protein S3 [Nanoarchaeota archaeon]MBU4452349.1 30S ribosomal protein S3 [Nanoarchaeota archaeon]MCG2723374.1 30S ribosomal protein S3 [archaeon]
MIERNFIKEGIRNADIEAYLCRELAHAEYSHSEIKRTPLNTRIIIYAGRPGMVIGRAGSNIQRLTEDLSVKFKIDKPQLEIKEIERPDLDARVVAKRIAEAIEKGNNARKIANIFIKKILHSGAIGAELVIAGKSSGGRSKSDKFIEGYLKKCGDTSEKYANRAKLTAFTKPGAIGIKVRIMRELPEEIKMIPKESKIEKKPAEEPAHDVRVEEAIAVIEVAPAEEKKAEKAPKEEKTLPVSPPAKLKKERKPRAKKEKVEKKEEPKEDAK